MWSGRVAFENDVCPVGDDLLGQLYRAHENGLSALVSSVSSDVRAMLALYCYRRSHLHSMGVAVATTCEERDLVQWGGRVGSTLFAISRENSATRAAAPLSGRRTITLSTAPLSQIPPLEDVDMDEAESHGPNAA
jgi:hypothetical protein